MTYLRVPSEKPSDHPRAIIGLPQGYEFVADHAPLFHLHPDDQYRPADLKTFLIHTRPSINSNFALVPDHISNLENLDWLNTVGSFAGQNIYLSSLDNTAGLDVKNSKISVWIGGAQIDSTGRAKDARTGAIIIVDKGEGVVDVFYFIFWAYNYGGIVAGRNLGNHVGDWEHVMIRFKESKPTKVWLSQHANGEAYTFEALEKNKDGTGDRPILYIAKGSHAIYAREGDVDHTIPNFNTTLPFLLVDQCRAGQIFDPLLSSYRYIYHPQIRTDRGALGLFEPLDYPKKRPGWLYFNGHWGDREYLAIDSRQKSLGPFQKFVDGPSGPVFKQLNRVRVWPDNSHAAGQLVRKSLDGTTRVRDQLREWFRRACSGKKKEMKIRGEPNRVYVDGEDARTRRIGKDNGVLAMEEEKA